MNYLKYLKNGSHQILYWKHFVSLQRCNQVPVYDQQKHPKDITHFIFPFPFLSSCWTMLVQL